MRALCGAIITTGALIGLGLTSIAFGVRYGQTVGLERTGTGEVQKLHLSQMDTPLVFCLVLLTIAVLVGFGITFVGLAYHHHRRYHEHLRLYGGGTPTSPPTTTSTVTTP